ncbi:MFS transporter [Nocardioides sp. SYSU D00038]|uniref:MFS transporter n=1 Tax=Nocardioides sp. SYSU D00038 TaxID=2812554 RepID=UPI0027DC4A6A|nr:MFS transporter [Nocardioides sp. SYSU D00038]
MTAAVEPVGTEPAVPVRNRWAGLAVLTASLLVVVMDMTILNVALPELSVELGAGALAQLWVVDAYALVLAGLLIPMSAVADRWGRRRMLLSGFAIFAVASTLALVVTSPGQLVALRAALGVGGAMVMPATLSLIRTLFPDPTERAYALGLWAATASVGAALGPVIGGALLQAFSWHAAFLVNVPVMVVAIVGGARLLPESRSARPGVLDPLGVTLSVVGMVATVYAVKHLARSGVDVEGVVALVVGAAALTAFVRRCLAQPRPMVALRLFANPVFRSGVFCALAASTAMMALLFTGSQWLQLVQGWSPLVAGVALVPLAVGGLVGSPFAPALAARVGARPVVVGGLVMLGLGSAAIALLPRPMPYVGLALAFGVVGLGTAALGVGSALIMGSAPVDDAGSAGAIEEISYELGGVLGVAVLGSLVGATYRHGLPADASPAAVDSVAGSVGTPWSAVAEAAFTDAFAVVGAVAAVVMLATAWAVWRMLPRELDLAELQH